jgi:hypothetical protein
MNVGADAWISPRINLGIYGVVGLLITSIKLCWCFNTLCMACPFADFKPIFFHYTKPLSLIFLRLMSLFSTFVVFLTTFHWKFPLGTLILTLTLLKILVFPTIQVDWLINHQGLFLTTIHFIHFSMFWCTQVPTKVQVLRA